MVNRSLVLFSATIILSRFYRVSSQPSLCNEDVISRIKTFWGEHVPRDVLNSDDAAGEGLTLLASSSLYPEDILCVYSTVDSDGFKITLEPTAGEEITDTVYVTEEYGVLSDIDSTTQRYIITNANGVQAIYTCTTDGAEGGATGLIRVLINQFDAKTVTINEGIMALLGIPMDNGYSSCLD